MEGFTFLLDKKILTHVINSQTKHGNGNPLTALMIARASDELVNKYKFELEELHLARKKYSLDNEI